MAERVHVRRVHATDAVRIRELRLRMLDDPAASIAFLESRETAQARPAVFWVDRAVGAALSDGVAQFIGEVDGRWVGSVAVLVPEAGSVDYLGREHPAGRATLVAVYVEPDHRGTGLLGRLAAAAADWSRDRGATELALDVHVDNEPAKAAYRRLGFVPTGVVTDAVNGPELEMAKPL